MIAEKSNATKTLKEQGFYHSPAWRRVRVQALQRDHYLCQECIRQHKRPIAIATEVHHVKPLEQYPDLALDIDNLESLCWPCHEQTKHRSTHASPSAPAGVRVLRIVSIDDEADASD